MLVVHTSHFVKSVLQNQFSALPNTDDVFRVSVGNCFNSYVMSNYRAELITMTIFFLQQYYTVVHKTNRTLHNR